MNTELKILNNNQSIANNEIVTLIKSVIGDEEVNAVSARELHKALELKKDFTDWAKQILPDFIQDIDFIEVHSKVNINNVKITEYYFSLDMAKQVAMLTRTAKGKEVRLYFIECEKQLKNQTRKLPQTYQEALRCLADEVDAHEETKLQLSHANQTIEEYKPKVDYYNELVESEMFTRLYDTAKELKQRPKQFVNWLIENKFLFRNARGELRPYAHYTPTYFELKDEICPDGNTRVVTKVTILGKEMLRNRLK